MKTYTQDEWNHMSLDILTKKYTDHDAEKF
ncbi:MAG: hypothetical protein Ct9H300mP18_10810 [Candidatus Neomarinimicrobiota bacterium]|nr:MAG: hypothetical protein Ct9H300mP18_10810 [Candidatus Neomarinimicrobiota bacterium]